MCSSQYRYRVPHGIEIFWSQMIFIEEIISPLCYLYKLTGKNSLGLTFNPLNPELNPICYLLALLAHHFLHVSRIRVKSLTLRLLMSYIYGEPILDVSSSHTTTQHSR